ncbi:bifunctional protein-serine/threonine kinase/phosphatase [Camelimonas lactis]|uniref:Serine/threonine protein kinase n=1 Tax=Camelimonas lactis TaxID=659006 RepID=A0A4R2GT66_9HYPH|nr:bifunctional protein-serine/threonine kinase/phosphatase [Camelimonas lactis]TCO12798.1 serine/threonine protein kinase [Camelimonas lactis]
MPLAISIGQHSDRGRKEINQDFHGALIPAGAALAMKGVAIAIADGISSSPVSGIAAEAAIRSFLTDYYCTSDAWTVKTSARRVITATNAWLNAETRRHADVGDADRGHVCSFSAMVLKGRQAHIFHVGDCRIGRLHGKSLEPLTEEHRLVVSSRHSYLARALGARPDVEIDYRVTDLHVGDVFVLSSDGVHEHVTGEDIAATLAAHPDDLDAAARALVGAALAAGSGDNLTVQIIRIESLPDSDADDWLADAALEPAAPPEPGALLDGYRIIRALHVSHRSHVFLATDPDTGEPVAIKTAATEMRGDALALRRLMMEEWIARRLKSPHVMKAAPRRRRSGVYVAAEYVDGQTLAQWMVDHPKPDLATIRDIAAQIAGGLRAFHRAEMVHQDLRPQNIMIDRFGAVKLIDFGATRVAGVVEAIPIAWEQIPGTVQYTAPEYFLGEQGDGRADVFSLGVIVYQMLTGRLPYGADVAKTRTRLQQARLVYTPAIEVRPDAPPWFDLAIRKATHPNPWKRHQDADEFIHDLRRPNPDLPGAARSPLIRRHPARFWQGVSAGLAAIVVVLLWRLSRVGDFF